MIRPYNILWKNPAFLQSNLQPPSLKSYYFMLQ